MKIYYNKEVQKLIMIIIISDLLRVTG